MFVVTVAVGQCSGLQPPPLIIENNYMFAFARVFYVVVVEVIVNVIVVLCCFLCQKP